MKPLLSIRSVPISIEHKVRRAALQQDSSPPGVNITRRRGGLNIQSTPSHVGIDTTEARASIGMKSPIRVNEESAASGRSAALEATRGYAEEKNHMADYHGSGTPIADISAQKSLDPVYQTTISFVPSTGPEYTVQSGSISFEYNMDKLMFDWNTQSKPFLEYVPGNIEFEIKQYPEVIIEYIGDPIYVPPSANPNYEPPPSMDVKG